MNGCTLSLKLFNKKDAIMKILITLLSAAASMVLMADEALKISPQEICRVVDEEVLVSLHPDDAQAAVDYLKRKGATDYLIAEAVARSLRRDINSAKDEDGWFKSNSGIYWLEKLGDCNQVSNLLYAAQVSTNIHASAAVRAFYRRLEDKGRFIGVAKGLLARPGMDQLKSTIWGLLEKEAEGAMRDKVLALAKEKLQSGVVNFYYADRILLRWQAGYEEEELRRSLLKKAISDPSFKASFPAAHEVLVRKLNGETKQ